ncbi:UNVERIFIED_CONTAM: hypothetical protein PYX00_011457 [Menopon gallinae]|uniref:Uncharacterized protein n=1 Tax=Menopon gallinae TaxID=328185 RepID=A0AAW2H7H9_9NEOP
MEDGLFDEVLSTLKYFKTRGLIIQSLTSSTILSPLQRERLRFRDKREDVIHHIQFGKRLCGRYSIERAPVLYQVVFKNLMAQKNLENCLAMCCRHGFKYLKVACLLLLYFTRKDPRFLLSGIQQAIKHRFRKLALFGMEAVRCRPGGTRLAAVCIPSTPLALKGGLWGPMAIIVFCGSESRDSKLPVLLGMLGGSLVEVHSGRHRDIRSRIQKSIKKVNIVNANLLKSERYELYLVARRYGRPYCVVCVPALEDPEGASARNRYDNPYIEWGCLTQDWLCRVLQADVARSEAHRNIIVNAQYLSDVKAAIERVNERHGNLFFFAEVERKVLRLLRGNPAELAEVEKGYERLILKEMQNRM